MQNDSTRSQGEARLESSVIDLSLERAARADRTRAPDTYTGPPAPEDLELHARHLWRCSQELRQAIASSDADLIAEMLDELDVLREFGPTLDFQTRCAMAIRVASGLIRQTEAVG